MTSSRLLPTAFVAGATGVIGRVLCRLLVDDGWNVAGTTRSAAKAAELHAWGVSPVVVDVFDREALMDAVLRAAPSVVVHQLTDLPKTFSPEALAASRPANARLREVGTAHLVEAAVAAGVRRFVVQSIAFAYAPGSRPFHEDAPLDEANYGAVVAMERLVLGAPLEGIVLRYGRLYGPNTWWGDEPPGDGPVHVDGAAHAARLAMTRGPRGVYNIAEDDGTVSSAKAVRELGWDSGFRRTPVLFSSPGRDQ